MNNLVTSQIASVGSKDVRDGLATHCCQEKPDLHVDFKQVQMVSWLRNCRENKKLMMSMVSAVPRQNSFTTLLLPIQSQNALMMITFFFYYTLEDLECEQNISSNADKKWNKQAYRFCLHWLPPSTEHGWAPELPLLNLVLWEPTWKAHWLLD